MLCRTRKRPTSRRQQSSNCKSVRSCFSGSRVLLQSHRWTCGFCTLAGAGRFSAEARHTCRLQVSARRNCFHLWWKHFCVWRRTAADDRADQAKLGCHPKCMSAVSPSVHTSSTVFQVRFILVWDHLFYAKPRESSRGSTNQCCWMPCMALQAMLFCQAAGRHGCHWQGPCQLLNRRFDLLSGCFCSCCCHVLMRSRHPAAKTTGPAW